MNCPAIVPLLILLGATCLDPREFNDAGPEDKGQWTCGESQEHPRNKILISTNRACCLCKILPTSIQLCFTRLHIRDRQSMVDLLPMKNCWGFLQLLNFFPSQMSTIAKFIAKFKKVFSGIRLIVVYFNEHRYSFLVSCRQNFALPLITEPNHYT